MVVGGIGGFYTTSAYVYNPAVVSSNSMNKVSKISDDVLDKKIEQEPAAENENPLQKGQTLNFQSMLDKQLQEGQMNASRIMKQPAEETAPVSTENQTAAVTSAQPAQQTQETQAAAQTQSAAQDQSADSGAAAQEQMQRAIQAYETFMVA